MPELTEEEYDALDAHYTENPPKVNPAKNGTGFFTRRKAAMADRAACSITVDSYTADYLLTKAIADHKTPADIISELVQEKIAVSV